MRQWALVAVLCVTGVPGYAELKNVAVGGSIEIGSAWYSEFVAYDPLGVPHIPDVYFLRRPIGPFGTRSYLHTDGDAHSLSYTEQRTRLHVNADFTHKVSAFVELDSVDVWGSDFRSDYVSGTDAPAASTDDLEWFQAYVQAEEFAGLPLRLRVGRQAMTYGSGWLVGENPASDPFTGLSFDAVRLTWSAGAFTLDAWASKLAERGALEEDGDVDFYGVYASVQALDDLTLDAYWMLVRDARSLNDTQLPWLDEWTENAFGYDDYDPTTLHTAGVRLAGTAGNFDFNAEAAFQFGEADAAGHLFRVGYYGDDSARFDGNWGANLEVGYTFDARFAPRVYLTAAYFSGSDNRSVGLAQWLNPFYKPEASVSFNRLFSDYEYDWFIDSSALTNSWLAIAGVSLQPTDELEIVANVTCLEALETFRSPRDFRTPRFRGHLSRPLEEGDDSLGWELGLSAIYACSEDLTCEAGWAHLFTGEGIADGVFAEENGFRFLGGGGRNDVDYIYSLFRLSFGDPPGVG